MPEGKELVGPNAPPRVTRPMAGTERLHVVQWNGQTQSWDSRVAWAEDIAALAPEAPGGGTYDPTLRVITSEEGEDFNGSILYSTVDGDVNNAIITPYTPNENRQVLRLPTTAAVVGDYLRVIHGNPEDLLGGYLPTDAGDLYLGYFDPYAEPGAHVGIALDGQGPAALPYGQVYLLQKTNEIEFNEAIFHFWKIVSSSPSSSSSGGSSTVARWDSQGYNAPEEYKYTSLQSAVDALRAVGGGTLEVSNGNISGGDSDWVDYDLSNIDVVGSWPGFRTILTINGGVRLYNARSIKGITVDRQNPPAEDLGVFHMDAGKRLTVIDCDLGDAYAAQSPIIYGVAYLHLLGNTRLGSGSVSSPSQIYVYARDEATVAEDAVASESAVVGYLSGSGYFDRSQANTPSFSLRREEQERFVQYDINAEDQSSIVAMPGSYINADVSLGDVEVAVFSGYRSLGNTSRVAKRGTGGNVLISGLTFVPGGGTTYEITVENDVVELHWLADGVQVKP